MRTSPTALFVLAALLVPAACSEPEGGSDRSPRSTDSGPAARDTRRDREPRPDPVPVDPDRTGAVLVRVTVEGDRPQLREISPPSSTGCVHDGPLYNEFAIVSADGEVANAFVRVRSGHEGWIPPEPPTEPFVVRQEGCRYDPHVIAVQLGRPVEVHNDDGITHNVNFRARKNQSSNRSQAAGAPPIELDLEREEDGIPVRCDIHPWMGAWMYVSEHPWFAVTREDGLARIEGLPAGEYELEVDHEKYRETRASVRVEAGATAEVEVVYEP